MARQQSLFGPDLLPGMSVLADVVTPAEERDLVARLDESELAPFRFQGWIGKRLTASFGYHYDFDRGKLDEGAPMPVWIDTLRERAALAAKLAPSELVLLLTRYDPGAGIGWHRDRSVFDTVVGVSLGAPALMRFRRRRAGGFDRFTLPLAPRSLYVLSEEARYEWEHSIAELADTRWSVTFRSLG
ncbi:MAG: alpha-ketoglutarate-dependent dioxygenase AlkB [Sphingomicrobium sp.]|nr:alpha-ketoglutarate-dependent dioxygenase AlkB [Sphingomonadales bacterium]